MPKQCQILAIEKGIKNETERLLTDAHRAIQKPALLAGLSRTYQPKDEEGESLPPESTKVQVNAKEILGAMAGIETKLWDITASKEWGNTIAKADLVLDGKTLLKDVPVTFLLFLEARLTGILSTLKKIPALDPADEWLPDETTGGYRTPVVSTNRTKKTPTAFVKAPATDKHPAQVDVFVEDVVVGTWNTVKWSGALPQARIDALIERANALQQAVKFARETANATDVEQKHVGKALFEVLFA